MSDAADALHFVSRWLQGDGSVRCVSVCGRYAAGDHCSHTLIVDALRRCYAVIHDVGPRYFETKTTEGGAELVLCAEGEDSRFHPCPPMTDLRWFTLETSPEIEWRPWPDPHEAGVPPVAAWAAGRRMWRAAAREGGDSTVSFQGSSSGRMEWAGLVLTLGVVVCLFLSGRGLVHAALQGGWHAVWWLPAGLVLLVATLASIGMALHCLDNLGWRRRASRPSEALLLSRFDCVLADDDAAAHGVTGALQMQVRAENPRAGPWTLPEVVASLSVEHLREPDGASLELTSTLSVAATASIVADTEAQDGSRLLTWRATLVPGRSSLERRDAGRWRVEWRVPGGGESELVAVMPVPAPPAKLQPMHVSNPSSRLEQFEALLEGYTSELILNAYHGPGISYGLIRHGGCPEVETDFTEDEKRAVFTVTFEELLDHAMQSGWAWRRLKEDETYDHRNLRFFRSEAGFKLLRRDDDRDDVLAEAPDLRGIVSAYLKKQGVLSLLRER